MHLLLQNIHVTLFYYDIKDYTNMHFSPRKLKFYRELKNKVSDRWNHIEDKYVKGYHHNDAKLQYRKGIALPF